MRQAGVLAAAGLVALEESPKGLAQDHANARLLAKGLEAIDGISIDSSKVVTNIVIFDVAGTGMDSDAFVSGLNARGVLCGTTGPTLVRFVTHYDVSEEQCRSAVGACGDLVGRR
jgi:threonine aldolase